MAANPAPATAFPDTNRPIDAMAATAAIEAAATTAERLRGLDDVGWPDCRGLFVVDVGAGSRQLRFIQLLLGGVRLRAQGLKLPFIDSFDAVQTGRPIPQRGRSHNTGR